MGLEKEHALVFAAYGYLKLTCLHPDQGCLRVIFIAVVNCIRILFLTLSFLLIPFGDGSITSMAEAVKSMTSWMQGFAKLPTIVFHEKQLAHLLKSIDEFWETDSKVNDGIYKFGHIVINTYKCCTVATTVIFTISPYFTHRYFNNSWIPDFKYSFEIFWFVGCFALSSDCISVVATDTLFLSLCIILIGQFRLINIKISSLNGKTENISQELKACIEHHKFLLKLAEIVIDSYSVGLLIQYLVTTFNTCMTIYEIAELNKDANLVISMFYMTALILQLSIYCFPADEVIQEALNTSFAIYSSEWYDFSVGMQKNICHVIRHSQHPINFSAGGFISINKEAFTVIFKGAFTFYTAIKQMKEKRMVD